MLKNNAQIKEIEKTLKNFLLFVLCFVFV